MKITNIITIPIFNIEVLVHCGDVVSLKDTLSTYYPTDVKNMDVNWGNEKGGIISNKNKNIHILYIKERSCVLSMCGTIAHEIFHLTLSIMNDCNIKLDKSSEEVYASLIEYLTSSIYEVMGIISLQHDPDELPK